MRDCAKMGCEASASASVAVRYADRSVLVEQLSEQADPNLLDLCREHTDRLTPPRGWRIVDQRRAALGTDGGVQVEMTA